MYKIFLFVLTFVTGCIPLKNVHNIDTYEIKKGKPRSKNAYYYDDDLDDPIQYGEKYRYVSITITGNGGVNYLA